MKIREYVNFPKVTETNQPQFINQCVACAESSTASLCVDEFEDKNGDKVKHFGSDVGLLLIENKFKKLNTFTLDSLVANLKRDVSSLSNFSDDSILKAVKSRYVQSCADMANYEKYLKNQIDTIIEDVKRNDRIEKMRKHYNED